jgi:NIPSNAP
MKVQLRRYTIAAGAMPQWVAEWSARIRPLRERHGFRVLGAWVVEGSDEFVWLLGYDGPGSWQDADAAYYASPERTMLDPDPARHIAGTRLDFVEPVA